LRECRFRRPGAVARGRVRGVRAARAGGGLQSLERSRRARERHGHAGALTVPRPGRLVAIGLAIFLCGLVALFPARVAYRALAPEGVSLAGLSGTLWNGAAAESSLGGVYLSELTWRFRPLALFTGKAGFAVSAMSS